MTITSNSRTGRQRTMWWGIHPPENAAEAANTTGDAEKGNQTDGGLLSSGAIIAEKNRQQRS